jgi:hypothetical protein
MEGPVTEGMLSTVGALAMAWTPARAAGTLAIAGKPAAAETTTSAWLGLNGRKKICCSGISNNTGSNISKDASNVRDVNQKKDTSDSTAESQATLPTSLPLLQQCLSYNIMLILC